MPQTYFIIPTAEGEAKIANAQALGEPIKFTHMAVGDGGGALPVPDRLRRSLVNEVRRRPLNTLAPDPANPGQYIAEQVIPETEGGWWIRELGLYDESGTLCFYGNCAETYKPQLAEGSGRTQVVRMVILVSAGASVELKVDPSIVLATRSYVDDAIVTALAMRDPKQSVRVATVNALASLSGLPVIDGIALSAADRVLVKSQAAAKDNGIYLAAAGAWTRAADADSPTEVTPGMLVPVESGTINADTLWVLATDGAITLGTTPLVFEPIAGGVLTATQLETDSGAVDNRYVTPKKLMAWVKQATETVFGMAKLATQAQTNAGTDDTTIVTPKKLRGGFAISLGQNGYIALPTWLGGLILQWGLVTCHATANTNSTFSLPTAFPTNFYGALFSHWWSAVPPNTIASVSGGTSGLSQIVVRATLPIAVVFYLAVGN